MVCVVTYIAPLIERLNFLECGPDVIVIYEAGYPRCRMFAQRKHPQSSVDRGNRKPSRPYPWTR